MAHPDDWFREPCLSDDAKAEFERRLSCARSARPEYMRIQAYSLRQAAKFPQALELYDRILTEYTDYLTEWIREGKAQCLDAMDRANEAIDLYIENIEAIKRHNRRSGESPVLLASLAFRKGRVDLYEKAVGYMIDALDPSPIFPAQEMQQFGWMAVLLKELGRISEAQPLARRALAASEKQMSSAANHPKLGVVHGQYSDLEKLLEKVVG